MNELTKIASIDSVTIAEKSTIELRGLLAKGLQITAQYFVILSKIWQELERRGEDLSEFKTGLMTYLPLIASNRLNPELLVMYAGKKTLLSILANLPMDVQNTLEKEPYVTIVKLSDEHRRQDLQVNLLDISVSDLHIIFSENHIRTPEEQYLLLLKQHIKPSSNKKPYRRTKKISIDRADKMLVVSDKAVSLESVIKELETYYQINLTELINNHEQSKD